MKKSSVREVRAVDSPYRPTFNGIQNAIEACLASQKTGQTESGWVTAVFEDGDRMHFPVRNNDNDVAKRAAKIAHFLRIEHNSNFCLEC